MSKNLGEILLEKRFVTKEQIMTALRIQAESSPYKWLGEILLEQGIIDQEQLREALCEQFPHYYGNGRTKR